MKKFYIEESGIYKIRTEIIAENKEEALGKLAKILDEELPMYINTKVIDIKVEEYNTKVEE